VCRAGPKRRFFFRRNQEARGCSPDFPLKKRFPPMPHFHPKRVVLPRYSPAPGFPRGGDPPWVRLPPQYPRGPRVVPQGPIARRDPISFPGVKRYEPVPHALANAFWGHTRGFPARSWGQQCTTQTPFFGVIVRHELFDKEPLGTEIGPKLGQPMRQTFGVRRAVSSSPTISKVSSLTPKRIIPPSMLANAET